MFLCFLHVGMNPSALKGTTDKTRIVSIVLLIKGASAGIINIIMGKLRQCIMQADESRMLSLENIPGCEICIKIIIYRA